MKTKKCANCSSNEFIWTNIMCLTEKKGCWDLCNPRWEQQVRCRCFHCGKDFQTKEDEGIEI